MSVVEGEDTALSSNMLISYATETLHPSALLEMGHNAAAAKTSMTCRREHTNAHNIMPINVVFCTNLPKNAEKIKMIKPK